LRLPGLELAQRVGGVVLGLLEVADLVVDLRPALRARGARARAQRDQLRVDRRERGVHALAVVVEVAPELVLVEVDGEGRRAVVLGAREGEPAGVLAPRAD